MPCLAILGRMLGLLALQQSAPMDLLLLPYPQEVRKLDGELPIGPPDCTTDDRPSETETVAAATLRSYLPKEGHSIPIRLGSIEEGYKQEWLDDAQASFLRQSQTSSEASVIKIEPEGITVVGKGRWGMLYGAQTINQLTVQAARERRNALPCLIIRDWPDMKWRCLSPQLTWYSGWNRLEGFDCGNWSCDEWKWLVDWTLLHKCNTWAVCMYGYWPFRLPGYENRTLDLDSYRYNPQTRQKERHHFTHPNIRREFFPDVIRYAKARGIKVHAYIGKNTFNGAGFQNEPAIYAGGAAELLPFAPGVEEYWKAFIGRILDLGFDGFLFEDPEMNHVPNRNEGCYKTFWEPWAAKYGFKSVADTKPLEPPLGVHIEYYTWLFREFDRIIGEEARKLGRPQPEIFLISHILLNRIMREVSDADERARWFALVDEKHGRKVPFVLFEANEKEYVRVFGRDRAITLGGRGASAICGMRRIASVNNCWWPQTMGADIAWDRSSQQRMFEAGGLGAIGYLFEWTNCEVFGYVAAQHLWRHTGVPSINNEDSVGFLGYAYRVLYGDSAGPLVARALDEGSCVNEYMLIDGVYSSQYPTTGPLQTREFQYLSVLADKAVPLADQAYREFTGKEPDPYHPVYQSDEFRWNGYDAAADHLFKSERLRYLYVSALRSQQMCRAAMAHRLAARLIAEHAPIRTILAQIDQAVEAARANQLLYQVNYDDDYDQSDGLCTKITEAIENLRRRFLEQNSIKDGSGSEGDKLNRPAALNLHEKWLDPLFIPWTKLEDQVPDQPDARMPGTYLSVDLGLNREPDFYRLGVVFSVEAFQNDGTWKLIFRRTVGRRVSGWEHWDIPLHVEDEQKQISLRLITDSYSRSTFYKTLPSWRWALWANPALIRLETGGHRSIQYDFCTNLHQARTYVKLDTEREMRPFDGNGIDSTGATFVHDGLDTPQSGVTLPVPAKTAIAAFTPNREGKLGTTIAQFDVPLEAGAKQER